MSLTALLNLPVTIVGRTQSASTDPYGNPVPDETILDTVGELQQQARSEPGGQGELSDTSWLLILPAGTQIDTGDQVAAAGQEFEVVGDPWHARDPDSRTEHHVEATLRRTGGEEGS